MIPSVNATAFAAEPYCRETSIRKLAESLFYSEISKDRLYKASGNPDGVSQDARRAFMLAQAFFDEYERFSDHDPDHTRETKRECECSGCSVRRSRRPRGKAIR